jgi:hypothetical protein
MSVPVEQHAFTAGEISPALLGRQDVARYHVGALTVRNLYVGYRGGVYSRAGTAFVGFSKQTGRAYPPRLIPFQFSINQGLALEFGNFYMRVVSNGAYVTETPAAITGITNAKPGVITLAPFIVASATANNGAVSSSYKPRDTVTIAGGVFTAAAVLSVANTLLLSVALNAAGGGSTYGKGYAPGDTITLAGGIATTQAQVGVLTTKVTAAQAFTGTGTNGVHTVTGTSGTGTPFQASVTVSGGNVTAVNSITVAGSYTKNPTNLAVEPVTGAGVSGCTLSLQMGVDTFQVTNGGVYTTNAVGGTFTQALSSGHGTGATFQTAVFGISALSVQNAGVYSTLPSNPAAQSATSGTGSGATYNLTSQAGSSFAANDWLYLSGIADGLGNSLNGRTVVVQPITSTTYGMYDVYGNPIDTTGMPAYTSGGTAARIFTLTTPYAEQDLPYLKYTQSADVMSLCCVNQQTLVEYAPQDLTRASDTSWTFTPAVPAPTVAAPTNVTVTNNNPGGTAGGLSYEVTAVDPNNGTESVASSSVDVALHATYFTGVVEKNTIAWDSVPNVKQYNIYRTYPSYGNATIPVGGLYGFIGSAYGASFLDTNAIVADFAQVPPLHKNPFARGQIIGATITAQGAGYTQATVGYTITTTTGSGATLTPIVVSGAVVGFIVSDAGQNYLASDIITITDGGGGTGATATLNVGAQTGTYPGCVSYIQERRAYGYTLNNPDTYFMSQPGAFTNFDVRIPTIESDAITGSPWAVQVNGIQFMVPMPGGLIVFTGLSAWQLTGNGGSSFTPQPIGPSTQQAQPQGYNGCSPTVPPIKIENAIVYVQSKGSIYREVNFNISANQYSGDDITIYSPQLFTGYTIREHAWCEEPYKVLWAVRNDGVLLSCTYLKAQQVQGWARHDTNGLFQSVCSVTELPVDALYCAVQRFPGANTAYMIERMNNRIWSNVEATWCVDAGVSNAQPTPAATLTANSATGLGSIDAVAGLLGGSGYSPATTASVVDFNGLGTSPGPGTGAVPSLTIVGGVITAVTFPIGSRGRNYVNPIIVFSDPANTGSGAAALAVINNSATFTASAAVFSLANTGSAIRMGGGIATVLEYLSPTSVRVNITSPIALTIPNSGGIPQPAAAGSWTMTAPGNTISGLDHLIGATVTGLADGVVIPPVVVPASGTIALPQPSTAVTLGLGFQAQLQSVYLDAGEPTQQGQRKKIAAVTVRLEASRGVLAGSNQIDGSTLSPPQIEPRWYIGAGGLTPLPDKGVPPFGSNVVPLFTGDVRVPLSGGWQTPGQVAVEQNLPLPLNVLAFISEVLSGDLPQTKAPERKQGRAAA